MKAPARPWFVYARTVSKWAGPGPRPFPLDRCFYSIAGWAEFTEASALESLHRFAERSLQHPDTVAVDVEIVERRCIECDGGVLRDKLRRRMRRPCECVELGGPAAQSYGFTFTLDQTLHLPLNKEDESGHRAERH